MALTSGVKAKPLSGKWYNVIRRELRASVVTYDGDPPVCPDCGCDTDLREGRFGRFYGCENVFACKGSVGARLDGTPRTPRGPSELLQARMRARDAIHEVILETCRRSSVNNTHWQDLNGSYSMVAGLIARILKRAEVWKDSGWLIIRAESPQGLFLRKRNLKELARIEAAAREELRLLRWTPYWDKLIEFSGEEPLSG